MGASCFGAAALSCLYARPECRGTVTLQPRAGDRPLVCARTSWTWLDPFRRLLFGLVGRSAKVSAAILRAGLRSGGSRAWSLQYALLAELYPFQPPAVWTSH